MKTGLCALLLAALCVASPAWAQDGEENTPRCISGTGDELTRNECVSSNDLLGLLDLATPENSLFTLMGATPDTVIRPKVGDRFMISMLPQVSDALQSEQYAIGVEVNPGLWMMPRSFTVAEYQGVADAWTGGQTRARQLRSAEIWSRFTISAAATRSSGDGGLSRYGVGFNYNYDSGSPIEVLRTGAYGDCIRRSFRIDAAREAQRAEGLAAIAIRNATRGEDGRTLEETDPDEFDRRVLADADRLLERDDAFAELRAQEANADETIAACGREVAPWNRTIYGAGVAAYFAQSDAAETPGGAGVENDETGFGAWASYARPLGHNGQFALSLRYTDGLLREREVAGDTVQESVDGWRIGARYTRSFSEGERATDGRAVRGFVEAAYVEESFGGIDDEYTQAGLGAEVQLQKNVFFQFVIGDTFGSDIDRSEYLSGQIRWSFSEAPAR